MDWVESTLTRLQDAGYRAGGARRAVVGLLGRQECCLSAQEIFDQLRAEDTRVGIASVYRVLDVLADRNLVQRVDLGDGVSRYQAARSEDEHHHHLVCDECGRVEPFSDGPLEDALDAVSTRLGYDVDAHDVVLHGACADCRPSPA